MEYASKVELVFSKSNLGLSALANSRFFNLFGYSWGMAPEFGSNTNRSWPAPHSLAMDLTSHLIATFI
jgi:hypothetical protein